MKVSRALLSSNNAKLCVSRFSLLFLSLPLSKNAQVENPDELEGRRGTRGWNTTEAVVFSSSWLVTPPRAVKLVVRCLLRVASSRT